MQILVCLVAIPLSTTQRKAWGNVTVSSFLQVDTSHHLTRSVAAEFFLTGTCEHGIVHLVEGSERASYTHFASYDKL